MEAGPQVELPCERPALPETIDDLIAAGKLLDPVPILRMSLERQDLAVDPEQPIPFSAQKRSEASNASAFAMQSRASFARPSARLIRPMAAAVVFD